MLRHYWRVIGFSAATMILFASCTILVIGYFGIHDTYARVIVGKTLSLFALAVFGQSEALKIYLQSHGQRETRILNWLNQFGAALTVVIALLLIRKIYFVENDIIFDESLARQQQIVAWMDAAIPYLLKHSEIASLCPLFFFAGINLLLWVKFEGGEEIGRVCFVISDLPVLFPMIGAIVFISLIGCYGSPSYKLLVGGATIMLIFSSIILTECTKMLLHVEGSVGTD